jgi:hypothetical protein
VDYVCRNEFDYSVKEIAEGAPLSSVRGIVYRAGDDTCRHTAARPADENLDALPWVTRVYKRDLDIEKYNIPWMHWPYASIYTTRGCPAQCTFCLWPQTTSGHRYSKRSVDDVIGEMTWAKENLRAVKEFFFDDDTFSFEKERTREIAQRLKPLGITWGGNARGNLGCSSPSRRCRGRSWGRSPLRLFCGVSSTRFSARSWSLARSSSSRGTPSPRPRERYGIGTAGPASWWRQTGPPTPSHMTRVWARR